MHSSCRLPAARLASWMMLVLFFLSVCPLEPLAKKRARGGKAKRGDAADFVLTSKAYLPLTAAQTKLKTVPFAPDAAAVILFEGKQQKWEGSTRELAHVYHRRVKILKASAIETEALFSPNITEKFLSIMARTVLPDGTTLDATDEVEIEERTLNHVKVTVRFPQVEVGAILDLVLSTAGTSMPVFPRQLQHEHPVLESRSVLFPPPFFAFNALLTPSIPEGTVSETFTAHGQSGHGWRIFDLPAIPREPNMPPVEDVSLRLTFVPLKPGPARAEPYTWTSFSALMDSQLNEWAKKKPGPAKELARRIASEGGPREKAEVIRKAVLELVPFFIFFRIPTSESPAALLERGGGTSGDLTALTLLMLRSVGVEAEALAVRPRSRGMVPPGHPVPILFTDFVIRLKDGSFLSPSHDVPVGRLPALFGGVLAVRVAKNAPEPVALPDYSAEDASTKRTARVKLNLDGSIEGELHTVFHGVTADHTRAETLTLSVEGRTHFVQRSLRTHMPGALVSGVQFSGLDDVSRDVEYTCKFTVMAYASGPTGTLSFNPRLFQRVTGEDWAAPTRMSSINLGGTSLAEEQVEWILPDGIANVQLPAKGNLDAAPVGRYEIDLRPEGATIHFRRLFRLDRYKFGPEGYAGLKSWHEDMARFDAQSIVLTLR